MEVEHNILTGDVEFNGKSKNDKAQGYFAYMELVNGFSKTLYMTKAEVEAHAKRYSASFNNSSSAWKTNFDEMAQKTVIRLLLSKFGIMSTEMVTALTSADDDVDSAVEQEVAEEANQTIIDVEAEVVGEAEEEGPGF